MRLTDFSENIGTVQAFLDQARNHGAGPRAKITYAVDSNGIPCFYIELPESAVAALARKERPPVRTKAQQAVRDQVEARLAAVKAESPVPGHVPPVARRGKVLKAKVKK